MFLQLNVPNVFLAEPVKILPSVRKTNHSKAKIKSWENEKVTDFQENIDEDREINGRYRTKYSQKYIV
jgi:hypothetical protein